MAGVRTTHKAYDEMVEQWKRASDVCNGQRSVHRAGTAYLPKLAGETDEEYTARVKRSDFFNATWRTIAGLTGMAFRKDPAVAVPAAIEPFLDDIDLAGTTLYSLAKDLTEDVLQYGRIGVLVDYPPMPENVTAISKAAQERLGLRPTIQTYGAECIINWRYERFGNATVLTMVVLKEDALVRTADEFTDESETRYCVLDLDEGGFYRQRVFRSKNNKDNKDELLSEVWPSMRGQRITYIPFVIVGANGMAGAVEEPPLIDLIDKNVAHYQVNSDYRHGAHFTALPTLFLAGIDEESAILIGGSAAVTARDPNARGEFLEYKGTGLGALENQLDRIERQMAVLGARMIADESRQAETLGATQIKRAGENSVLAAIVINVSDTITWALGIMAEWAGAAGDVEYSINREFLPQGMDAQQLTALVGAWQSGALSDLELFDLFQRGDVIDGGKDYEQHQEEVSQMALPAPVAPAIGAVG